MCVVEGKQARSELWRLRVNDFEENSLILPRPSIDIVRKATTWAIP